MTGIRLIAVAVEVVADREPVRQRLVVRRDVHVIDDA